MNSKPTPTQELNDLNYRYKCGCIQRAVMRLARKTINRVAKITLMRAYDRQIINSHQMHEMVDIVDRIPYPNWYDPKEPKLKSAAARKIKL